MAMLEVKDLQVYYGVIQALKGISFEVNQGEVIALIGANGAGKTTTLQTLTGIIPSKAGSIRFEGKDITKVPAHKIVEMGMAHVPEGRRVFADMTVYENLAFGLKLAGCGREEIARRVEETAALLEIKGLLDKPSEQVEGIDRYKVVVGRALARRPEILLMDDPMISLDGEMRRQMREGLAEIHHRLGVTAVYVTEDASEAMLLGNRLVVMRDGAIEQDGTAEEIYHRPCCRFVAGYFGSPAINVIQAKVERDGDRVIFQAEEHRGVFTEEAGRALLDGGYQGKEILVGIRPEDICLDPESIQRWRENAIRACADACEEDEDGTYMTFRIGDEVLKARVSGETKIQPGDMAELTVDSSKIYIFDKDTQKAI